MTHIRVYTEFLIYGYIHVYVDYIAQRIVIPFVYINIGQYKIQREIPCVQTIFKRAKLKINK